jgi:pyruvate/2-oxoglutarate dehydrogenase complex dihydrolipoamide acyltransferase (E2) component
MSEEFFIPKLGQTVEEVTLVTWWSKTARKSARAKA